MTSTATLATRALRSIWPTPITLRCTVNTNGDLEVTAGRGCINNAAAAADVISRGLGTTWRLVHVEQLRSNARFTYRLVPTKATFEQVGEPHTWPAGQVDKATVHARHAAVRDTGTPTGYDADPGQLVIHLELGTPGVYDHRAPDAADCSYVRFAGETEPTLVHSTDVVVLTSHWLPCLPLDDDTHLDHGQAVSPECLVDDPDHELVGPELRADGPGRLIADDGVEVTYHSDTKTYWAYGPKAGHFGKNHICSGQPRLEATHRWINWYRADVAQQREDSHELAQTVDTLRTAVNKTIRRVNDAENTLRSAIEQHRNCDYERRQLRAVSITYQRVKLALELALDSHIGCRRRFVVVSESNDDGTTWQVLWAWPDESLDAETSPEHALRYATERELVKVNRCVQPKPWRVQVWTDPIAEQPDAVWTNLTAPCRRGKHDLGDRTPRIGPDRADGTRIETGCCTNCFHQVWRVAPAGRIPSSDPWVLEGEPLRAADPSITALPIETVLTRHYGMEINDGLGTWRTLIGVGPLNPDTRLVEVTTDGLTTRLRGGTVVQLRAAAEGLDGDAEPETQNPGRATTTRPQGLDEPVSLGFRILVRNRRTWRPVRTGHTPPMFKAVQNQLDGLADTVLSNARQVLGLDTGERAPAIRVQTWDRLSGLTGRTDRRAGRSRTRRSEGAQNQP